MRFDRALIFAPMLEQRNTKIAWSLNAMGIPTTVIGEENTARDGFKSYLEGVEFVRVPSPAGRLSRLPIGSARRQFIKRYIDAIGPSENVLVIARDVNYGSIVSRILGKNHDENIFFMTDIADNFDLLYASYSDPFKRLALRIGFGSMTKKSLACSDGIITVSPVNGPRLREAYPKLVDGKPILLLRNLPITLEYIQNDDKLENSMVYVGKLDEISRDLLYVVKKLQELPEYTLHFYSDRKKHTIDKIKTLARELGVDGRVFFHQKVAYDALTAELSRYRIGLVPHKRSPVTDYTVPNKLYDYKNAGIVTVMSDCPALIRENDDFAFGYVYSREKDDFCETVRATARHSTDDIGEIPSWADEFTVIIDSL